MPTAKYEIKRKCDVCGATFIAKTLDSRYCSKACSQKAYNRHKAENKKREQQNAIIATVPDGRDYISVAEAEAMFGISGKTIRRMVKSGKLPAVNIGQRLTRVSKSALLSMVPLREEPIDRTKPLLSSTVWSRRIATLSERLPRSSASTTARSTPTSANTPYPQGRLATTSTRPRRILTTYTKMS